eukprot:6213161-Pleurochrysis_carterae.AAC.4
MHTDPPKSFYYTTDNKLGTDWQFLPMPASERFGKKTSGRWRRPIKLAFLRSFFTPALINQFVFRVHEQERPNLLDQPQHFLPAPLGWPRLRLANAIPSYASGRPEADERRLGDAWQLANVDFGKWLDDYVADSFSHYGHKQHFVSILLRVRECICHPPFHALAHALTEPCTRERTRHL